MRLVPLLAQHTLTGVLEYDDGVQFSAAEQLVAGHLPYRDFVFIQPPGVALLLSPFAALAHWTGDTIAMATARLVFIAVAATNAALIAHVLRSCGRAAALSGGLLYAVWQATVAAEHTLLLEPLLTLGVLAAMLLIDDPKRRNACVWAGVVVGAAASIKLWMGPVALVFIWIAYRRHGKQDALRFSLSFVAAFIVLCAPFLAAAPPQFYRQVFTDQINRPGSGATIWERLQYFSGLTVHTKLDADLTVHGLALIAVVGLGAIIALSWNDKGSRPWMAIGAMELFLIMVAPSFSYHYVDFPAGTVCVLVGMAVPQLRRQMGRLGQTGRLVITLAGVAILFVLSLSTVTSPVGTSTDQPKLASFVKNEHCVWTTTASLLIALNVETRQIQRNCPYTTDPYGTVLDISGGSADRSNNAIVVTGPHLPEWQRIVRSQLLASSAIVATPGTVTQGWDSGTVARFHADYVPVGRSVGWVYALSTSRVNPHGPIHGAIEMVR
jgi:4-amino-4-deoxy-L-arabinose transferase-like glycosyltransferase